MAFDAENVFDATNMEHECVWDETLKPIGEYPWEKESSFPDWWKRVNKQLGHLRPQIAEQWIHRHWKRTPFKHVQLENLTWRLEQWKTSDIFEKIYVRNDCWRNGLDSLTPDGDYEENKNDEDQPAKSLRSIGTWDYPIVVISTPNGVRDYDEHLAHVRFCMIEGHWRLQLLWAWASKKLAADRHQVFVLEVTK
jgi:hypothetical protein